MPFTIIQKTDSNKFCDLYAEHYKILIKEIKDLSEWTECTMFVHRKIEHNKNVSSAQIDI